MTLRGLVAELAERGVKVSYRTVWNFVHREKISYKKSVFPAEQNRPDVARHRARWKRYQDKIDPKRLVFIVETWVIMYKSLDLILRTMSDLTIHLTADIIGEADPLLSMTALQAAAGGGRKAIIDKSGPLATLAAKR
jgi:hypothetical protein